MTFKACGFLKALKVSHLFFADDSLLFAKARMASAIGLRHVIRDYEVTSGHMVNFQKSSLYFRPYVDQVMIEKIKNVLNFEVVQWHLMYLSLSSLISRNKRDIF